MRFNDRIEIHYLDTVEHDYNPDNGKDNETIAEQADIRSAYVSEPTDEDVVQVFGKIRDGVVRVRLHGSVRRPISHVISKGVRYNVTRQRVTERRNKTVLIGEVAR